MEEGKSVGFLGAIASEESVATEALDTLVGAVLGHVSYNRNHRNLIRDDTTAPSFSLSNKFPHDEELTDLLREEGILSFYEGAAFFKNQFPQQGEPTHTIEVFYLGTSNLNVYNPMVIIGVYKYTSKGDISYKIIDKEIDAVTTAGKRKPVEMYPLNPTPAGALPNQPLS